MSVAAELAIAQWINLRPIVGEGNALSLGAFTIQQRSPEGGTYAVLHRTTTGFAAPVAEGNDPSMAHIDCAVYSGLQSTAEIAAAALRSEFEKLTGCPEWCGDTGVKVLVAENFSGPNHVDPPAEGGEEFCYLVSADFMLTEGG